MSNFELLTGNFLSGEDVIYPKSINTERGPIKFAIDLETDERLLYV